MESLMAALQANLEDLSGPESPLNAFQQQRAVQLFSNGQCVPLSQSQDRFQFAVEDEFQDFQLTVEWDAERQLIGAPEVDKEKHPALLHHLLACLWQLQAELKRIDAKAMTIGKKYTREGMIRRVLKERQLKAEKAPYRIDFAENPYGEHLLYNEKGSEYRITFRDLVGETGYCSCKDYRANKLGTCKHLMFAYLKKEKGEKNLCAARVNLILL